MSRFNTGNPLGSGDPRDLDDNAKNLDLAVNSDEDLFRDRFGQPALTWTGVVKTGTGDPGEIVRIVSDAVADGISSAEEQATRAQNEADRAEAAADSAASSGRLYQDSAAGQADPSLPNGAYFWAVSADSNNTIELWRKGSSTPTDTGKRQPSSSLVNSMRDSVEGLDEFSANISVNQFLSGDFSDISNLPPRRSGSPVVSLTDAQKPLSDLGYSRAMQWRSSGNEFVKYEVGVDLRGKWITAGFVLWSASSADVTSVNGTTVYGSDGNALISPVGPPVLGHVDLGNNRRLVWATRQMPLDHPVPFTALWIGSAVSPTTAGRFATGFFSVVSSEAKAPDSLIYEVIARAKAQRDIDTLNIPEAPGVKSGALQVTLAGSGNDLSFVESDTLQRAFIAFPSESPTSAPDRFNLRSDYINGTLLRDGSDDIAPDHIDGATVGGNHGYTAGRMTADGHGKTDADCGSVWASGGDTFVLAEVISANTLLMVREGQNTAPVAGTFTHVSGAVNTSSIVATVAASTQWYPPHRDYQIRVYADGDEVSERAAQFTADKVQFVESASLIARADILEAWKAEGGMPAGWEPNAPPSIAQTITYAYDKRGQLTIARDWLTLKAITVTDYMGLQFGRVGAQTYIIPGALPFAYQGETLDYSMGVDADKTLASGVSIDFDSTMLQAEGEYANRLLAVYPDAVFALGFLPVGDAAPGVRRDRVSNKALQIRGNSAKVYFRVLDIGSHVSPPGDYYSVVAYRFLLPKSEERTAFYAVDGGGATWVYADWHGKEGLDRLPIDREFPELIGRTFEVFEARNVDAVDGVIAGSLPVIVSAAGSSATLILKVSR